MTKVMSTANATPRGACPGRDPLYVEVSPLLGRHLAGIGRFAARLIEALARKTTLRLVNTIEGEHARNMRLSKVLRCAHEIPVTDPQLPSPHADLPRRARRLFPPPP